MRDWSVANALHNICVSVCGCVWFLLDQLQWKGAAWSVTAGYFDVRRTVCQAGTECNSTASPQTSPRAWALQPKNPTRLGLAAGMDSKQQLRSTNFHAVANKRLNPASAGGFAWRGRWVLNDVASHQHGVT